MIINADKNCQRLTHKISIKDIKQKEYKNFMIPWSRETFIYTFYEKSFKFLKVHCTMELDLFCSTNLFLDLN